MEEINLDSSIWGFCSLHRDIVYVRSHGVLMRDDADFRQHPERVAVISGGGAGHEPGQLGFVGRGMLSAAVSGNIFTSPSVTRYDLDDPRQRIALVTLVSLHFQLSGGASPHRRRQSTDSSRRQQLHGRSIELRPGSRDGTQRPQLPLREAPHRRRRLLD